MFCWGTAISESTLFSFHAEMVSKYFSSSCRKVKSNASKTASAKRRRRSAGQLSQPRAPMRVSRCCVAFRCSCATVMLASLRQAWQCSCVCFPFKSRHVGVLTALVDHFQDYWRLKWYVELTVTSLTYRCTSVFAPCVSVVTAFDSATPQLWSFFTIDIASSEWLENLRELLPLNTTASK